MYAKFVKDLNCEANNGIVGENFVISEIQGFKSRGGFNKTTAETLTWVVVKQKIGEVWRTGQSPFL